MVYRMLLRIKVRLDSLLGLNSAHIPIKLIKSLLIRDKDPLVIDVGCNIGEFAEIIFRFNKEANIIAFDINKNLNNILKRKFQKYKFKYLRIGLSNFNGFGFVNSGTKFDRKANLSSKGSASNRIIIARLDEILKVTGNKKISILKIDTEGNDFRVLKGAHKSLLKTEIVIFELMYRSLTYGHTPEDFLVYLKSRGFNYFYRSTKYFGLIEIQTLKPWDIMTQNIVCSRTVIDKSRFLI